MTDKSIESDRRNDNRRNIDRRLVEIDVSEDKRVSDDRRKEDERRTEEDRRS